MGGMHSSLCVPVQSDSYDCVEEPDVLALVREYDHKITQRYNHWQQRLMEQHSSTNWAGEKVAPCTRRRLILLISES